MSTPPEEITYEIFDQILAWNGKEEANELTRSHQLLATWDSLFAHYITYIIAKLNYSSVLGRIYMIESAF